MLTFTCLDIFQSSQVELPSIDTKKMMANYKNSKFMKKTIFLLFCLFGINSLFAQATNITLSVTDVTGSYVYWEYNFNSTGGFISQSGPGAPMNTPIIIKLSSQSLPLPTFSSGDMNGNCDNYLVGSMNANNTAFQTNLTSCCPSIAEMILPNGLKFWVSIKCAASGTPYNCVTYTYSSCGTSIYCITFNAPANIPAICRTKNHTVVLNFTDGTQATVIVNFANNFTTFCFGKPILGIASASFSNCCPTGPQPKESIGLMEEVIITPNPTKSIVKFNARDLTQFTIRLVDVNGKILINSKPLAEEVDLSSYPKGIYFYSIEDKFGNVQTGKIVKE